MRDESDSEDEGDNAEFLAHGVDLDLPEEESGDEDEVEDDGSQDSELEDYYEELGIAGQKDFTKKDDDQKLYKTTKKKEQKKQQEEKKASDKTKVIEAIINRTREEPSYKTISRIVKIIKQVFNTPTAKDEKEAVKASERNIGQLQKALNTSEYRLIFDFFLTELPKLIVKLCKIKTELFVPGKFNAKKIYGGLAQK